METKFTPGPWTVKQDTKPYPIYGVGPNGIEEESLFKTPLGHVFRSHVRGHEGQQLANALLISAAPELLEACQWALTELEEPENSTGDTLHDTLTKLKAAINKALNINP